MAAIFQTTFSNGFSWMKMYELWLTFHWWRHQVETFSALLAFCAGNSPVTGEFPTQWPVTRSFDLVFDLRLNKQFSKQSWSWWFETPSHSLCRQCDAIEFQWGSRKYQGYLDRYDIGINTAWDSSYFPVLRASNEKNDPGYIRHHT